ncbi:UNVERIFIED_CONTAM: hypothetical protein Scaly_1153400 [Sesamum calycinum]|uniref:DUF4218 domain-containing protein n=1 Tax=Sesamum calycinum TaxID=2727403 RepID=A0AAW2Q2P1_9LAMI
MRVCEWICGLKFPDGYASNLARWVDITELRMHGMKSHDYHIFMQKLIPIVFREMLPEHVWSALTEVSILFQNICSTTLDVHKLHELENIVAIILCNLEKIFPSAFFDSMEHLIVHLSYEARVGGPVQYRWMYRFERFLHELKKKLEEVVPVLVVATDNHSYDLRDPNSTRVVLEAIGTSWRQVHENDDENEDTAAGTMRLMMRNTKLHDIPADSGAVGSDAAEASSSQAPARPWDAPPPPMLPAPLLPPQAQRHYISLQDARFDRDFYTAINMRSKGIIRIPGLTYRRSHRSSTILVPNTEGKLATGGTATTRACSRSSSRKPRSSCGSGLPTPTTSWPDHCGWPRRSGASFWSFRQAQNSRHSRARIRSIGRPTQKQRRPSTAEVFLRLLRKRQGEENSNEELAPSSQAFVTPNEQQLWMSAAGGQRLSIQSRL